MAKINSTGYAIIAAMLICAIVGGLFQSGIIVHVSGTARLKPPAPTPTEVSQEKQREASSKGKQQSDSDRPSKPSPAKILDVKVDPKSTQSNRQGGQSDEESPQHWWPKPVTDFTAVLAIAAVLQLVIYGFQAFYMYKGLVVTRIAADAAKMSADAVADSNKLSRDTAEKQLRAYITATDLEVSLDEKSGKYVFVLHVENSGQTPATRVEINSDKVITDFPAAGEFTFRRLAPDRHISKTVCGPGCDLTHRKEYDVTAEEVAAIEAREKVFWFFGRVHYRDIYQHWQTTWFRYISGGNAKMTDMEHFVFADGGNYLEQNEGHISSNDARPVE